MELEGETLKVERIFALVCGEFLRVYYSGPKYLENLVIHNSRITDADTTLVEKIVPLPRFGLPEEELIKQLQEFFSQSSAKVRPPTYHNIKRFEYHLRELPWQEDLSAIYHGDGVFRI